MYRRKRNQIFEILCGIQLLQVPSFRSEYQFDVSTSLLSKKVPSNGTHIRLLTSISLFRFEYYGAKVKQCVFLIIVQVHIPCSDESVNNSFLVKESHSL